MVRVRLLGSPQTQWNIDGSYKPGRDVIELTPEQVKKNSKIIAEILDTEEVIEDKIVLPEPIVEEPKQAVVEEKPVKRKYKKRVSK